MNLDRFHAPDTPVGERIEQLELDPPRPKEKQWLKQTLATRWPEDLPQPFRSLYVGGTFMLKAANYMSRKGIPPPWLGCQTPARN